jgi:hypothetical protein
MMFEVFSAEVLRPFGYLIVLRVGFVHVELHAVMSANWSPNWRLTAFGEATIAEVQFTPSYVQAGSAVAFIATGRAESRYGSADHNGHEGEWREIALAAGAAEPGLAPSVLIDDLRFALRYRRENCRLRPHSTGGSNMSALTVQADAAAPVTSLPSSRRYPSNWHLPTKPPMNPPTSSRSRAPADGQLARPPRSHPARAECS